ncbi:MAG TPA: hypothetical protein VGU43_06235, partial [Thermoplasmata archaeon]|nr:hypothetical protein [Thermoplasmata archaeon]
LATAGVAPLAQWATRAEQRLDGPRPSDEALVACAEMVAQEAPVRADRRATDPYRRILLRALLERALRAVRDRAASA